MSAFAIDVHGLTKKFGSKVAVDHVDIQVPEGEVWGFLGPNGSGKTTTIRMLCGLLRPDDGSGTCLGYDIRTQSEQIKREVGYMTQRFSFWEDLSIRENLEFVARLYGLPDRQAKVDHTLQRLGLVKRQKQRAGELSGGGKQRMRGTAHRAAHHGSNEESRTEDAACIPGGIAHGRREDLENGQQRHYPEGHSSAKHALDEIVTDAHDFRRGKRKQAHCQTTRDRLQPHRRLGQAPEPHPQTQQNFDERHRTEPADKPQHRINAKFTGVHQLVGRAME